MKKLLVQYNGWGERWPLGTLADNGNDLLFEYTSQALRKGLELSPLHLKVQAPAYSGFPAHLHRLPGLIADSLPDGWGQLLMDRVFRRRGINAASLSVLDRLAFLGERTMGALTYEPAESEQSPSDAALETLAQDVRTVISGSDEALSQLAVLGGAPHGARPKVLVYYDVSRGMVSTRPRPDHAPWLVKFPAQTEHKEVCALEHLYAQVARLCGLEVAETHYFDLGRNLAAFAIARFDVEGGMRVPVHTLAGALHADFRVPTVDYTTFLRAVHLFSRDEREVNKAYERAAFNVLFNNRDDHCKNFSFRLSRDLQWRLAPCYDVTFSEGPRGEPQMDVCGEARNITRAHMLELAKQGGVRIETATEVLDRFIAHARGFRPLAQEYKIRRATLTTVAKSIEANAHRLG
jgi:serine/threonine-protein kinase HipA